MDESYLLKVPNFLNRLNLLNLVNSPGLYKDVLIINTNAMTEEIFKNSDFYTSVKKLTYLTLANYIYGSSDDKIPLLLKESNYALGLYGFIFPEMAVSNYGNSTSSLFNLQTKQNRFVSFIDPLTVPSSYFNNLEISFTDVPLTQLLDELKHSK